MKTLQNHQKAIEKVVPKEGLIDGYWVNPRTVNNPAKEIVKIKDMVTKVTSRCILQENSSLKHVSVYRKGKMTRRVTMKTAANTMKM